MINDCGCADSYNAAATGRVADQAREKTTECAKALLTEDEGAEVAESVAKGAKAAATQTSQAEKHHKRW